MATFRILGDRVLTKADYLRQSSVQDDSTGHPLAELFASDDAALDAPGKTQRVAIGLNRPLTILIQYIYTGRYPKSLFGGGKPMLVVTGLKDFSEYAPASRAVNLLTGDVSPRHRMVVPSAFDAGTNVVAYSPAVLTDSLHFTVEIAFDRFPQELAQTISSSLSKLSGIPLLLPAQGYLLAASTLISTGAEWADALIDGKASFSVTDSLDFNLPGVSPPTADFRVLCHFDASGMTFDPKKGLLRSDGSQYNGDEPYVVLSLDGASRPKLEAFAPTLATAAILKQFFHMRQFGEASADAILGGVRLLNDMKFRKEALAIKARLPGAGVQEKEELEAQLQAVLKNILTQELKPS